MNNKEIFDDFKKRVLWIINEVKKGTHGSQYAQPVIFTIKNAIEKMEMDKYKEYPWKEFQDKNPSRYEIKIGRFGAYFYDNKLKCDLDLQAILRNLHKLELMEKAKEG